MRGETRRNRHMAKVTSYSGLRGVAGFLWLQGEVQVSGGLGTEVPGSRNRGEVRVWIKSQKRQYLSFKVMKRIEKLFSHIHALIIFAAHNFARCYASAAYVVMQCLQSVCMWACLCVCVRLSRSVILSKRINVSSKFFSPSHTICHFSFSTPNDIGIRLFRREPP